MVFEYYAFSKRAIQTYGLHYVLNGLKKAGISVQEYDNKTQNPVLVSLYWQEQLYSFIKWRYANNMKRRRVIVGGNFPTTAPQIFKSLDCDVFLGDGEKFNINSNEYFAEEEIKKKIAVADTLDPFAYIEVQKAKRGFCEISRGCKNKCLFCQYSWLKPYRESSIDSIRDVLKEIKTQGINQVRCFAADRMQHSDYKKIIDVVSSNNMHDTSCDITLKNGLKNSISSKEVNGYQVGLEGMSERLRALVKKSITDDEFISFCIKIADEGKKVVTCYMIYGLPTETDEDVEQFEKLIKRADNELPEGFVIVLHWNAFQPNALTPLQWSAPAMSPRKRLCDFWNKRINSKIILTQQPRETSEWLMLKRILAIRTDKKTIHLPFTIARTGDTRKKYGKQLMSEYKKIVGFDIADEWPRDEPLPWDAFIDYDVGRLLKIYSRAVK